MIGRDDSGRSRRDCRQSLGSGSDDQFVLGLVAVVDGPGAEAMTALGYRVVGSVIPTGDSGRLDTARVMLEGTWR